MSVTLSDYNLPDAFLFKEETSGFIVWQPEETVIVLGHSNSIESSLYTDAIITDNLSVMKRPSGGEAVGLAESTVAFTVARRFSVMIPFRDYFKIVNSVVFIGLEEIGVSGLGSNGISDITIGNRKILGSSMRKVTDKLVYHAVLNLEQDPSFFRKYLRHPCREPDYRAGRSHDEFVTSLSGEGCHLTVEDVQQWLSRSLEAYYPIVFVDAIHVKVHRKRSVENEAFYVIMGVKEDKSRKILGIFSRPSETASLSEVLISKQNPEKSYTG
jgi:lipoate-protein ligase A